MRAVLQVLTGRDSGRRHPVAEGPFPVGDDAQHPAAGLWLESRPDGWLIRQAGPPIGLRVNGHPTTNALLRDRDIVGVGRRLFRIYVLDGGRRSVAAPKRTIALPEESTMVVRRQRGLSTVVTAPGRWGDVAARWYGGAVLRLRGGPDAHPEQLVARLGRRVRCHALLASGAVSVGPGDEPTTDGPQFIALTQPDLGDAPQIREAWERGRFVGVLSPVEPEILMSRLRAIAPLLARPETVKPLLSLPDPSIVDGLRSVDAALLFGGPDDWELFCCPEMLPVWRRVGFPTTEAGAPAWNCETTECESGLTRFVGDQATIRAADVAATLAGRHALYLLLDAAAMVTLPAQLPVVHLPAIGGRFPLLITPDAGGARFDLIDALWGRGLVVALLSGRGDRDVGRLLAQTPDWFESPARLFRDLTDLPGRDRLGGFQAALLDPGGGRWAVFADPKPVPVWQRYGIPAPTMEAVA